MCKFKEAIKRYRDGATLDLFVTLEADRVVFPAACNTWRKRVEIKVHSEARGNRANKEVLKTVAGFFDKKVEEVVFVSGEKSREKTVLVRSVSVDQVVDRLKEYL